MKFSATELRQDSSKVFNHVQACGWVKICGRSRPEMILLTQEEFDSLLVSKYEEGKNESNNDK
jgi:hypothetical protein